MITTSPRDFTEITNMRCTICHTLVMRVPFLEMYCECYAMTLPAPDDDWTATDYPECWQRVEDEYE